MFVPRTVSRKTPGRSNLPTLASLTKLNPVNNNSANNAATLVGEQPSPHVQVQVQVQVQGQVQDTSLNVTGLLTKVIDTAPEVDEKPGDQNDGNGPMIGFSFSQRLAGEGDPVCVICGHFGEYTSQATQHRVCSLECKTLDEEKNNIPTSSENSNPKSGLSDPKPLPQTPPSPPSPPSSQPPVISLSDAVIGPQLPPMPQPGNNRMVTVITAYKESQATGATSDTTLAQLKGTHQLKIQGRHPPLPISSFDECGLPPKLLLNLFENKHTIPTPVQMQVIPAGLQGRDMLIMAETGSGKSASYLIPILTHVYGLAQVFGSNGMWASPIAADASDTSGSNQGPFGLILVPTRELAHQVETMAKTFARGLPNMLTAILVGGYAMANQAHRLRQNVQLVIATPGRLLDIMARHPEFTFSNVFCLVLDEVDMMFSLGFGKQVKRIMDILPIPPNGRQTIMCSATIPKQVEVLAKKMLMDPLTIQLGHPSSRNDAAAAAAESGATNVTTTRGKGKVEQTVRDESGADVFSPASRIKQTILWVENASKKKQLFSLLNDPKYYRPPVLVFVESRLGADLLATAIMQKCRGIETAVSMHAEKSQDERDEIMKALVEGTVPVVVATGLLARGLNLKVATVINFDMAPTIQEYVHRVGRANPEMATKAALGIRKGPKLNGMAWAITFINQDDSPLLRELATMLSGLGLDRVTPLPQQLKQLLDTKPLSSTTSHGPSRTAVVQKSSLKTSKERDKVKIKTTDSNSRVSVPVPPAVNPGVKIKQTKRPRPSQQKHQKSKKKRIQ